MSQAYPCPNPTCTHVFPAAAVQGRSSLHCPRCGTVFQFRAGPSPAPIPPTAAPPPRQPRPTVPAAPKPPVPGTTNLPDWLRPEPTARPPAPPPLRPAPVAMPAVGLPVPPPPRPAPAPPPAAVPMALPVAIPVPPAEEAGGQTAEALAPPDDFTSPLRGRRKRHWGWLVALLLVGLVTGGVLYATRAHLRQAFDTEKHDLSGPAYVSRDFNYRFVWPGKEWAKDDALMVFTRANALALRRANPDAWVALAARDYKKFTPDPGQLVDEAVRRLTGYFRTFEWEQKGEVDWAGRRAQHLVFQGDVDGSMLSGECLLLGHQGVGYCLTTWTRSETVARTPDWVGAEFGDLRRRFALNNDRENWQEQRPVHAYLGKQVPYELRNVAGPWQRWDDPKAEDEAADLLLIGDDPDEPKDAAKRATILVLLLPKQPDTVAAGKSALAHIEAHHKQTYPDTTLEVLKDSAGKPVDLDVLVGDLPGRLVKLRVTNGEARERFLVLAAVPHGEHVLAIQCECDWKRRSRWEALFLQVLSECRLQAGPG